MTSVRVRFAPSPTGYLHVGGARTLFFNWLYAKKHKGSLIVRVEDTDQLRSTRESEKMILSDIDRLGLDYQEGPEIEGPHSPYRQSERRQIYARLAEKLLQDNKAYFCFCSDATLAKKREAAFKMGKTPHYDGTCAQISHHDAQLRLSQGEKACLRFRAPQKNFLLRDFVRDDVDFKEGMVGDFLITRTPGKDEQEYVPHIGFPVYNFCCVVDDHLMEISHVVRAEEHLSNTVRQLMIYDAFGWVPPQFAHISLVLGADRQKLSKRSGDVSVFEYIEKGYLPEALLNFIALLGWWPPAGIQPVSGHPEILSISELISHFNFEGLQKSPAVFDVSKLNWMNSYYISHLPISDLARRARPFFDKAEVKIGKHSPQWFEDVLALVRGEAHLLSDLPKVAELFLEGTPELEVDAKLVLKEQSSAQVITSLVEELRSVEGEITPSEVEQLPKVLASKTGIKGKSLFMPIRVAITGKTHGPELKLILPLLGRETVLRRIKNLTNSALV